MSQVIGFEQSLKLFDMKIVRQAMATTLNQAAVRAKKVQSDAVGEVYNVKAADVKKTILIKKASPQRLSGALISTSRQLPLISFVKTKAQLDKAQSAQGVTATIKRGHPKFFKGAFINRLTPLSARHQHIGVAKRKPGTQSKKAPPIQRGPRKGQPVKREAIRQLMGVSIAHLTDNPQVIDATIAKIQELAPNLFDRNLRAVIGRNIKRNIARSL